MFCHCTYKYLVLFEVRIYFAPENIKFIILVNYVTLFQATWSKSRGRSRSRIRCRSRSNSSSGGGSSDRGELGEGGVDGDGMGGEVGAGGGAGVEGGGEEVYRSPRRVTVKEELDKQIKTLAKYGFKKLLVKSS